MRPLGDVKARCSSPQVVALGLLLISEENGHCECPFPVRTSLVFAPAERRLNEDGAFFFTRPADTRVRQAAINFGAPGGRRDAEGTLWLGYPRKEAGGTRVALIKEFHHIAATDTLSLEFIPREPLTAATAPLLSALDVIEEGFTLPVVAQELK